MSIQLSNVLRVVLIQLSNEFQVMAIQLSHELRVVAIQLSNNFGLWLYSSVINSGYGYTAQ